MATKKNLRTFSVILIVAILLAMSACVEDDLIVLNSFSKADFGTEGVATISYLTGDTAIQQEYIHIYFGD